MKVNDIQINRIVDRVVDQLSGQSNETVPQASHEDRREKKRPVEKPVKTALKRGCFLSIEEAINAAEQAFIQFQATSLEKRKRIVQAIREICLDHIEEISRIAVDETGLGRYEDKIEKNRLAIQKTPGVEDVEPKAFTGDDGLTVEERAPFGIVGSITPTTNPSETIICNGIGIISGGNSVVFNPHPSAKKTSAFTIDLLNQAVISEGGPTNLFTMVSTPTIESAQAMMTHRKINLLVVTGGPAVVRVAMQSGKRVIAAGPGNPPVVVDETADLDKAGKDIVTSAGFDNNIICVLEKEIIVTEKAADGLKKALIRHGAVELGQHQSRRLEKIILDGKYPNKKWVGKDIQKILAEIGLSVSPEKRIAIVEAGPSHPFATTELLMPVLPFIRVKDIDSAIELAYTLENGCFHTAVIHSKNIDHMHRMAVKMNTSIFVKNGMAVAGLGIGGEGPTSFTIASPTGEGLSTAKHFTRTRRCTLSGYFRIV